VFATEDNDAGGGTVPEPVENTFEEEVRRVERLLLTPAEAAHMLGLGKTKVFELMGSGALMSVQVGRARRIPRPAVEAFVDGLIRDQSRRTA